MNQEIYQLDIRVRTIMLTIKKINSLDYNQITNIDDYEIKHLAYAPS